MKYAPRSTDASYRRLEYCISLAPIRFRRRYRVESFMFFPDFSSSILSETSRPVPFVREFILDGARILPNAVVTALATVVLARLCLSPRSGVATHAVGRSSIARTSTFHVNRGYWGNTAACGAAATNLVAGGEGAVLSSVSGALTSLARWRRGMPSSRTRWRDSYVPYFLWL